MKKKSVLTLVVVGIISVVMIIILTGTKKKPGQGTILLLQTTDSTRVVISSKGPNHTVIWQDGIMTTKGLKTLNGGAWASQPQMDVLDSTGKPFKGEYISVNTVGKAGQ